MMKISMAFDSVAKTALVTIDGDPNRVLAVEMSGYLDQFLFNVVLQGWTMLVGYRGMPPEILDPKKVMEILATRKGFPPPDGPEGDWGGDSGPKPDPTGPTLSPSDDPESENSKSKSSDQEKRNSDLFQSWVGKKN